MDVLRSVIVLVHIIGFAVTFGALVSSAVSRRFEFTRVMDYGIVISLVTGLALAAPWGDFEPNYPKIAVKLVLLMVLGGVLGMGSAFQKRDGKPVGPVWVTIAAVLSATAAGVAVIW
ncbi:Fe-S protein [Gordonia sp. NPDC003376]